MEGLKKAIETVNRLRGPGGCPWDQAQTHESLRKFLLEETYEVLEALDSGDKKQLKEELGDLLLQILLHAKIAEEEKIFTLDQLAGELADKLVRRHPHVFGENKLSTAEEVVKSWEKTKEKEKPKNSVLDGIPAALPALQKSLKVIEKVSKVGFQWKDIEGPLEKVKEELQEFLIEIEAAQKNQAITRDTKLPKEFLEKIDSEMGDLFFTLSNVAYFLHLNPEDSMRKMLSRFEKRFRYVETQAKSQGKKLESMSLEEMDELWREAKLIPSQEG
jgi:tetrapyrrole methylase family protein / MazG family protein